MDWQKGGEDWKVWIYSKEIWTHEEVLTHGIEVSTHEDSGQFLRNEWSSVDTWIISVDTWRQRLKKFYKKLELTSKAIISGFRDPNTESVDTCDQEVQTQQKVSTHEIQKVSTHEKNVDT